MPTLFLAPTAKEARRAAWDFVSQSRAASQVSPLAALLDPPLIFSAAAGAEAWRGLARDSARSHPAQTTFAPRLIRAEAFFARSYASLMRRRALSGADRLWVLQNAARRAAKAAAGSDLEAELLRLATHRDSLRAAARHLTGLRRANLSRFPAAPSADARSVDARSVDALNALLHVYNARLEALNAFDFEAAPALFPLAAERNRAFSWPRALLVDDETELSPALQMGLDALMEHADCVAATLVGEPENPALLGAMQWWQARGATVERVGDWNSPGARAATRILGGDASVSPPSKLFLTSTHTPRDEMERIAARIRAEVEAGARPDDFALGCADLAAYEADARHAFAAHGVPLDWPRAAPLGHSPLVRALLGALQGAAQKLDVHALHDGFGDGTLRWQSEEKSLDARRLRAAALVARHVELDDPEAARAAFERKRAQLVRESRHDDAHGRTALELCLAAGDLELVAEFQVLRAPLGESAAAGEWQARVGELVGRLTAHWTQTNSAAGARARRDLERFFAAVENVAARARGWDDGEQEPARAAGEWMAWLRAEIEMDAGLESETHREEARGGVRVGGIDSAAGGARATFWCGLSEGVWPSAPVSGPARALETLLDAHRASPLARATHHLARAISESAISESASSESASSESAIVNANAVTANAARTIAAIATATANATVTQAPATANAATANAAIDEAILCANAFGESAANRTVTGGSAPPASEAGRTAGISGQTAMDRNGARRSLDEKGALYLSHARHLDGRETPASPLLDDLSAAFPGAKWPSLPPVAQHNATTHNATTHNAMTRRAMLQAWQPWFEAGQGVSPAAALPLEEQQQLQRLSRMRGARRGSELGVYDGVLGARGQALMELRDQMSGGARLSGSDLEFYARCPIRYFFERVLALRHAEREGDDIDARAAGTLVHQIAREWITRGAAARQSGDFAAGLVLLDEITRQNCEKLPIRPILREAEWRRLMGFDGQSGPLVKWLRLELGGGSGAWGAPMRPVAHSDLEIEGLSGEGAGLEHRFEIELGGHRIKGFIDRIDSSEDGAHLAVIDYKTGDIAGLPVWKSGDGGLHFQLAIYALALQYLGFGGAPPRLAMAYLSLKRAKIARGIGQEGTLGKGCSGAKSLDDAAFAAWLDDVSARAARIGDLRAGGVFNLSLQAPKDAKCEGCASKSLCGQHAPTQAARFEAHQGSPFVYLPGMRAWET